MQQPRRILGIDPGSRITGFGLVEAKAIGQPSLRIASGHWALKQEEMGERLSQLYFSVHAFIKEFQPTEVAIERVFVHKNAMSALKLGQARGVAIAAAVAHQLPIFEYAPKEIKQAVVGTGSGDKHQVQHMVKLLLRLPGLPQADEADALAIAVCHLHSHQSWRMK